MRFTQIDWMSEFEKTMKRLLKEIFHLMDRFQSIVHLPINGEFIVRFVEIKIIEPIFNPKWMQREVCNIWMVR